MDWLNTIDHYVSHLMKPIGFFMDGKKMRELNIKNSDNKKHSENADTSTSVIFDLQVKVKNAMSLDVVYCVVPWCQVWCLQV